jgi:hypothetical protein
LGYVFLSRVWPPDLSALISRESTGSIPVTGPILARDCIVDLLHFRISGVVPFTIAAQLRQMGFNV